MFESVYIARRCSPPDSCDDQMFRSRQHLTDAFAVVVLISVGATALSETGHAVNLLPAAEATAELGNWAQRLQQLPVPA